MELPIQISLLLGVNDYYKKLHNLFNHLLLEAISHDERLDVEKRVDYMLYLHDKVDFKKEIFYSFDSKLLDVKLDDLYISVSDLRDLINPDSKESHLKLLSRQDCYECEYSMDVNFISKSFFNTNFDWLKKLAVESSKEIITKYPYEKFLAYEKRYGETRARKRKQEEEKRTKELEKSASCLKN